MPIKSIDAEACVACGNCIMVCPNDIIREAPETKKACIAYQEDCTACRLCAAHCPWGAIVVAPGAVYYRSELFAMKQYCLGLGINLSQAEASFQED